MRKITAKQLTAVHTLLSKSGMKDGKKEIILSYTNGRSDSSKDLTFKEAEQLISSLKDPDNTEAKADKMRRKIISIAHEMGWKLESGKIDMRHVNDWCIKFGYLHKRLDDYTYKELPLLVSQFEKTYKDYLNNI